MTARSQAAPADAVATSWVEHASPRLRPWLRLARLDRPIGTWLLFWPCVFGLLLGAAADERRFLEWRDLYYVLLFGIGALVMRGAGCTFNDIIDRNIDAQVARTRGRPIPSGAITTRQAVLFLIVQCLVGLGILLQFNWFAVALGASSLLLVAAYPFMKRITFWPQAVLGLAFAYGGLMGWAAAFGSLALPAFAIYACAIFWTIGYDTIYALQDARDDAIAGVRSTARLFAANVRSGVSLFYLLAVLAGALAVYAAGGHILAWAGLFGFSLHLSWQIRSIDPEDPARALMLFRSNRNSGLILFAGLALDGLLVKSFS